MGVGGGVMIASRAAKVCPPVQAEVGIERPSAIQAEGLRGARVRTSQIRRNRKDILATPSDLSDPHGRIRRVIPSIPNAHRLRRLREERIGWERRDRHRGRIRRQQAGRDRRAAHRRWRPRREACAHVRRDRACARAARLPSRERAVELRAGRTQRGAHACRGPRVGRDEAVLETELVGPERCLLGAVRGIADLPGPKEPVLQSI